MKCGLRREVQDGGRLGVKRILVIKIQAVNEMFRRIINGFPLLGGKPTQGQEGKVWLESNNRLQPRSGATSTRRPSFQLFPALLPGVGVDMADRA